MRSEDKDCQTSHFHILQERIAELEIQMESRPGSRPSSRSGSRPASVRGSQSELRREKRGADLVLSVADLQENFNKVKSYEAEILEQTNK